MKMNKLLYIKIILPALLLAISLSIYGCSTLSNLNLYSTTDDVKLGENLNTEIQKNQKDYHVLNNAAATQYVQNIVNTIISSPEVKYAKVFPYKVKILNDDKTVNAFCTPGGFVYVYTGLLKLIDNEATLAGILAHEIAHAEQRHSTKRMTKAYGAQYATELALGKTPDKTEEMVANLFTGMALLKNSRDDEYEADEYSFKYLYSLNKWYPGAIKMFFDKITGNEDNNTFKTLLSTHPVGPERVAAVNKLLKQFNVFPPTEENLGFRKYKELKKMLG
jgi:beta-barrel assembly-enhancing protease